MSNHYSQINPVYQNYQRQLPSQSQTSHDQTQSQSSIYKGQTINSINLMKTFVPPTQCNVGKDEPSLAQIMKYLRKYGFNETTSTLLFEINSNNEKIRKNQMENEVDCTSIDKLVDNSQKVESTISYNIISDKYSKFRNWVLNSLSSTRNELVSVCFVVFINIFFNLSRNPVGNNCIDFLNKYAIDFTMSKYREITSILRSSNNMDQLKNMNLIKPFIGSRFHIILKPTTISLLNNFMLSYCDTYIIGIIQEKLVIHVFNNDINRKRALSKDRLEELSRIKELNTVHIGELYSENLLLVELNSKTMQKTSGYQDLPLIAKDHSKLLEDMSGKGCSIDNSLFNWGLLPENFSGIIPKEEEMKKSKLKRFDQEVTEELKIPIEVDFVPMNDPNNPFTFNFKKQLYEEISNRKFVDITHPPSIICNGLTYSNHNEVIDMSVSHDHEFGAYCTEDGCIQAYYIKDPKKKIDPIWIHRNRVQCVRFNPWNHEFLLSGGIDSTIKLSFVSLEGEEPSLTQLVTFIGHTSNSCIWDLNWDDFGVYFISGSSDQTARLWCTSRTYPVRIFTGHLGDVRSVSVHPNSSIVATGGSDNQIIIWDVRTGKREGIIYNENVSSGIINQVKFSHNGYLLASSSIYDPLCRRFPKNQLKLPIWDIRKLNVSNKSTNFYQLCELPHEVSSSNEQIFFKSLDFSFGSRIVASTTNNGIVSLWDTNVESSFNQTDSPSRKLISTQIYKLKNSSSKSLKFLSRNLLSISYIKY
ncbi:Transcription initiation factor TFIID subunit 5 [Cryptosporidium felis]|nr:Transcription initiation factor TFIID subunit 5 [Cryptosporidium felis]